MMTRPDDPTSTLDVRLGDSHVGYLRVVDADYVEFSFSESYLEHPRRPVLGQHFEDDLRSKYRRRFRLPYFSNLLPEGPLRDLLASAHSLRTTDDIRLLAALGHDLPGAVRVVPLGEIIHSIADDGMVAAEGSALRFSLAGVQLKFSMLREGRGLTVPAQGRGGDWIVKLPDSRFDFVPENEFSMLQWAAAAGIDVPTHELVPVSALEGLPLEARDLSGNALAVRRFDRSAQGPVHMEDFAQVFDSFAEDKYERVNFEQLATVIARVTGDALAFVARLVFDVAIGNADAHLKNWSLLYPDGITAKLSPAYDLVSTIQYIRDDRLALNLARSKDFGRVSIDSFRRFARRVGLDEAAVVREVAATVGRIRDAWAKVESDVPVPASFRQRLVEHQARVPLLREV